MNPYQTDNLEMIKVPDRSKLREVYGFSAMGLAGFCVSGWMMFATEFPQNQSTSRCLACIATSLIFFLIGFAGLGAADEAYNAYRDDNPRG